MSGLQEHTREALKKCVIDDVFTTYGDKHRYAYAETDKENGPMFDFRRVTMQPKVLATITDAFWEMHQDVQPFQLCGLESAAIALSVGIAQHLHLSGRYEDINAVYIRKSRKKEDLLEMVEGTLQEDVPVVLVDDIINSGRSFIRQVEVLEALGFRVIGVWALLRFRDEEFYRYFHEKGIAVRSVLELNDITTETGEKNVAPPTPRPPAQQALEQVWRFQGKNPNHQLVVPKSAPVVDATRVYIGTDDGVMWALDQATGKTAWSFKAFGSTAKKGIFSTPLVYDDVVYFGAYDGNVYALDAQTGERKWVHFSADWIGSSPTMAPKHNLVFIGVEYGLWNKHGGMLALNAQTGALVWRAECDGLTHATPLYIEEHDQVVIGSNDGVVRLYDALSGALVWEHATGDVSDSQKIRGFSDYDIKESCAYHAGFDYVCVGNMDGACTILDRKTGSEVFVFRAEFAVWATPVIHSNVLIFSSLDKHVYALDLKTHTLVWKYTAGARIFAEPCVYDGVVYIGSNAGHLVELDVHTGEECGTTTLTERITNRIVVHDQTKRFFVSTFANELYCLKRPDNTA